MADQREVNDEIADALAHPVSFDDENFDEDELEKELEDLEKELGELTVNNVLPSVPQNDIKTRTESMIILKLLSIYFYKHIFFRKERKACSGSLVNVRRSKEKQHFFR